MAETLGPHDTEDLDISLDRHDYNFAPLLTAKAVTDDANQDNPRGLYIVKIPVSLLESPLTPNLPPYKLWNIQRSLTESGSRNGREIWLSWRRAWDLWNNHYIEGRVNKEWVRGELERKGEEMKNKPKTTKRRERSREKVEQDQVKKVPQVYSTYTAPPNEDRPPNAPSQGQKWVRGTEERVWELVDDFDRPPRVEDDDGTESGISQPDNGDEEGGGFVPRKRMRGFNEALGLENWINNSVWRPRRVGEGPDEVNLIDDCERAAAARRAAGAQDEVLTEFEVDGGVDCAPAPFPLLRWVDTLTTTPTGGSLFFRKRKLWDEVTGTIFNLPMIPLSRESELLDERQQLIKKHWAIPDDPLRPTCVFPLDIRRCEHMSHPESFHTFAKDEKVVSFRYENETRNYRVMELDDPWWVTMKQEKRRDVPPRRWPPAERNPDEEELFAYDDLNWISHRVRDRNGESRYFATNLTYSTLIINGAEITRGHVAGPLPSFAIIETPDGQVSFWFGEVGTDKELQPEPSLKTSQQWKVLRGMGGEWTNIGINAGEVWDRKINERLQREENGEEGSDDEEWESYKHFYPKEVIIEEDSRTLGRLPPTLNTVVSTVNSTSEDSLPSQTAAKRNDKIRVPRTFKTPEAELCYAATGSAHLGSAIGAAIKEPMIEPVSPFKGPNSIESIGGQTVSSRAVVDEWNSRKLDIITTQKKAISSNRQGVSSAREEVLKRVKRRDRGPPGNMSRVKRTRVQDPMEIEEYCTTTNVLNGEEFLKMYRTPAELQRQYERNKVKRIERLEQTQGLSHAKAMEMYDSMIAAEEKVKAAKVATRIQKLRTEREIPHADAVQAYNNEKGHIEKVVEETRRKRRELKRRDEQKKARKEMHNQNEAKNAELKAKRDATRIERLGRMRAPDKNRNEAYMKQLQEKIQRDRENSIKKDREKWKRAETKRKDHEAYVASQTHPWEAPFEYSAETLSPYSTEDIMQFREWDRKMFQYGEVKSPIEANYDEHYWVLLQWRYTQWKRVRDQRRQNKDKSHMEGRVFNTRKQDLEETIKCMGESHGKSADEMAKTYGAKSAQDWVEMELNAERNTGGGNGKSQDMDLFRGWFGANPEEQYQTHKEMRDLVVIRNQILQRYCRRVARRVIETRAAIEYKSPEEVLKEDGFPSMDAYLSHQVEKLEKLKPRMKELYLFEEDELRDRGGEKLLATARAQIVHLNQEEEMEIERNMRFVMALEGEDMWETQTQLAERPPILRHNFAGGGDGWSAEI